jgi:hypothetical protein
MIRGLVLAGAILAAAGCEGPPTGDPASLHRPRLLGVSRNPDSPTGRWRVDEKTATGPSAPFFVVVIAGDGAPSVGCDLEVPAGFVEVRCETGADLTLGTSEPIALGSGRSFAPVTFRDPVLPAVGTAAGDLRFSWAARREGPYAEFARVPFRLFAILSTPCFPWVAFPDSADNPHAPWVRALGLAAVWARGSRSREEAAARITQSVYDLGSGSAPRLRWNGERSHFCVNYAQIPARNAFTLDRFDLDRLLEVLENPHGGPQEVDCNDIASTVYALSNLLGCSLTLMSLGVDQALSTAPELRFSPVRPLGHDGVVDHLTLLTHQVAWSGSPGRNGFVYDASLGLLVSGAAVPACGWRFGDAGDPESYVRRLSPDAIFLIPTGSQHRPIAPLRIQESPPDH